MGAIDKLARKLGFVRIAKYGLVHTPDDRILSMRPTVLDDGVGGKIVGWLENDLAAMELDRWGAVKLAPPKKIEMPKMAPPPKPEIPKAALVVAPAAPAPVVEVAPAPAPKPLPGVAAYVAPPPQVAPEPPVEEDEWEWEIAVARARAEAQPVAAPIPAARTPKVTSQPVAAVAKQVVKALAPEPKAPSFVSTPGTVIPVPALPSVTDPSRVRPVAVAPKRYPKATGRVEDTIVTHAAPPANDDKTHPSIALPPAGSARRVAAKQR